MVLPPEEFNQISSQQKEWVENILKSENERLIVAEKDGKVVGWVVFEITKNRKRLSHTGSFGILIRRGYRGLEIGKMLLKALLEWAEKNPLIEKVSLGVLLAKMIKKEEEGIFY
ncbi:hypothetical protein IE3_05442 [Bacillus cereus BAG3X2-1]|nr:hypothetical protein IE3_05442 [Bacillus cereus BAG3X2-1]PET98459.1 GNAT family N-acetyltransferase [Bacillus cereus]PEV96051.1 GNAT family N-acetyltransferase [Bacillus cereus]PFA32245.1 GNAT family N-acetyltransferase [Bacillus cereus]PFE68914.1 GNAT family N-acetyltransferase [Bacillus cereus]